MQHLLEGWDFLFWGWFFFVRVKIFESTTKNKIKRKKIPTPIILNFANLSDEWGYLLLCATVGWGELSYQCLMYWIMGLLHKVHLLCSYSDRCKELISLSKKCSLKIRPEINTDTQLWNALKLFLGDKLLLRYIDPSTKVTPIEFIRQII